MAKIAEPSYADLVYEVLKESREPLTFQQIFDEVNRRRPVTTKNPKGTIRGALGQGSQLISLGDGRYGYLPHLVQGSLLRQPLVEKKPANHPLVYPDEVREALWPSFFESQKRKSTRPVRLLLPGGEEVELSLEFFGRGLWGSSMPEGLRRYLVESRAAAGDALLIRVVDGESGRCEGRFEPRRKRDKAAIEARNRELAEIAFRVLDRSPSLELFIWDLADALLARGAYRSDVAPDPLAEVLKADPRFVYAEEDSWMLAEFVTPEVQATIDRRKMFEANRPSGAMEAAEAPSETISSLSKRYAMERTLADVGKVLSEREFESMEEANAFLREMLRGGGVPRRVPETPLERAQEVMYDAWESPDPKDRVQLAWRALQISRDCADAYVLLAQETARNAKEAAELYVKGVAAGERALGKQAFEENAGHFWGLLKTRPYMRARLGLALELWELGKREDAIDHAWEMLRLNPNDNQGVRYLLLSWLLEIDDDSGAKGLLDRYPDDIAGQWAYGRALHAFRTEADTSRARKLRVEAKKRNPHAPAYLLGRKRLPKQSPDRIGIGDESEAIAIAEEQGTAWRKTPGALAWLESA